MPATKNFWVTIDADGRCTLWEGRKKYLEKLGGAWRPEGTAPSKDIQFLGDCPSSRCTDPSKWLDAPPEFWDRARETPQRVRLEDAET